MIGSDELETFLEKSPPSTRHDSSRRKDKLCWLLAIISTTLLATQTIVSIAWIHRQSSKVSYTTGFSTDFAPFKSSLKLTETRFTGALHSHPNGNLFMVTDPSSPRFVNGPEDELEKNWNTLISGRYFRLSPAETKTVDPIALHAGTQQPPSIITQSFNKRRGLYGGADMFHSLHCLNALRKAADNISMDNEGYSPEFLVTHIMHCVEQLRQSIMCHGDLTPVTLTPVFERGAGRLSLVGQTEYPHTCRDWRAVREALDERQSLEMDLGLLD